MNVEMKYIRLSRLNSFPSLLLLTWNHLVYRSLLDTETKSLPFGVSNERPSISFHSNERTAEQLCLSISRKLVKFRFRSPSQGILLPIIFSQLNEYLKIYRIELFTNFTIIYIYFLTARFITIIVTPPDNLQYSIILSPSPILAALHPHATGNYINTRPIT